MAENNPSNVFSAFEILLEEIEAEIDFLQELVVKLCKGVIIKKQRS
jgi:hypothetical protein